MGKVVLVIGAVVLGLYMLGAAKHGGAGGEAAGESYWLVHAIGNEERVVAKGLSERECQARKSEQIKVAEALGVPGSITCLPASLFDG